LAAVGNRCCFKFRFAAAQSMTNRRRNALPSLKQGITKMTENTSMQYYVAFKEKYCNLNFDCDPPLAWELLVRFLLCQLTHS
jgi:hypothetical protein